MSETRDMQRFGQLVLDDLKESIEAGDFYLDAETIADMAVACGLMVYEPYDPSRHENVTGVIPGEEIYYWGGVSKKEKGQ